MYANFKIAEEYLKSLRIEREGKIFLRLPNKSIYVGWLKPLNCGSFLYEKQQKVKNLFKKFTAWGLNYEIIKNLGKHGYIRLYSDDNRIWEIDAETALKEGKFLHFKKEGFEKQIFVPIKFFRIRKGK